MMEADNFVEDNQIFDPETGLCYNKKFITLSILIKNKLDGVPLSERYIYRDTYIAEDSEGNSYLISRNDDSDRESSTDESDSSSDSSSSDDDNSKQMDSNNEQNESKETQSEEKEAMEEKSE